MSSSKYKKNTTISTFKFKINDINFSSTKVFKDIRNFIAKNLELNHHIIYIYRIAIITPFKIKRALSLRI